MAAAFESCEQTVPLQAHETPWTLGLPIRGPQVSSELCLPMLPHRWCPPEGGDAVSSILHYATLMRRLPLLYEGVRYACDDVPCDRCSVLPRYGSSEAPLSLQMLVQLCSAAAVGHSLCTMMRKMPVSKVGDSRTKKRSAGRLLPALLILPGQEPLDVMQPVESVEVWATRSLLRPSWALQMLCHCCCRRPRGVRSETGGH